MVAAAVIGGAALSAGAGIIGSGMQADAATKAAGIQATAATHAADLQFQQFLSTQHQLQPFADFGGYAQQALAPLIGVGPTAAPGGPLAAPLTRQFQPTMDELEATPGFQFTRDQGLKATQNALTTSGLGKSGSAVAGATSFAEGLASTTYNDQLKNFLAQNQQTFNMLTGAVNTGENAAAMTGQIGQQAAGAAGNFLTNAGAASAGGVVGAANALASGFSNAGNAASNAALTYSIYGQNGANGANNFGYNGSFAPVNFAARNQLAEGGM